MCGICGTYDAHGVDVAALETMAEAIRHRGPDDDGFYFNDDSVVGLASRRLSIIDLSTGKQPISNEDGCIWIVFNGEIYNYPALRDLLLERGHQFKTQTDTEVIVHLYEEFGIDCATKLDGMFTFAIWDETRDRLMLARDPLGQKHLYYTFKDGVFAFASEIKALLTDPSYRPQMNLRAVHNLISLRCVPDTDTLFEGIDKLPAGHILLLEHGEMHTMRYFDVQYQPKVTGSDADIIAQLHDLLLKTVESHMLSDVPIGAFLSGGIDSSLVAAMMSTLADKPINTFSIGVKEDDFNELPYARMVVERYGTQHYEHIVEPDLVGLLPEMLWYMEEPVDPFAFGVFSVAKLASQHVKVALGGDGGDEMFAGYDRYFGNQLTDLYCLLPAPMREHLIEPVIRRLPDNFSYNNRVQKLRWLVAMSKTDPAQRYAHSASFLRFSHEHKQVLYSDSLWESLAEYNPLDYLLSFYHADNAQEAVDKMLHTDVKSRLSDHLLVVNDRMTMAHSLEGRSPYLGVELTNFVTRIPTHLKLNGRKLKYILREVSKRYLPDTLVTRPKQGFSFPLAYWFRNELRTTAENLFAQSHLVEAGYFRREAMFQFLNEHVSGQIDHNYRLWILVNLELWYRLFIEGTPQHDLEDVLRQCAANTALSSAAVAQPLQ